MYTISHTLTAISISAPGYVETICAPFDIQATEGGFNIASQGKHFSCAIADIAQYNAFFTTGLLPSVAAAKIANIVKALASPSISVSGNISASAENPITLINDNLYSVKRLAFELVESITITALSTECKYNGAEVPIGYSVTGIGYPQFQNIDGRDWSYTLTGKLKATNFKILNNQWNTSEEIRLYLVSKGLGAPSVFNLKFVDNDIEILLQDSNSILNTGFSSEADIYGIEDLAAAIYGTVSAEAFADATSITTVKLDWAQSVGNSCFDNSSVTTVSLRRLAANGLGASSANNGVFNNCYSLQSLTVNAIHANDADVDYVKAITPSCKVQFHYANPETPIA